MLNRYELIGHLGKDPEIRNLDGDKMVATFSVATTRKSKNREGEKIEHTEWHNVVMWNALARIAEKYLKKGDQVFVTGEHKTRKYEDSQGITRYSSDLVVKELVMLSAKRQEKPEPTVDTQGNLHNPNEGSENLPF